MKDLTEFFKKFNIKPNNKELYERAFTHSSFNADTSSNSLNDYERLEFVGDALLGFVIASLLYKEYEYLKEGDLTKAKASFVQSKTLAKKAVELGFNQFIRSGHSLSFEEASKNRSILEDVFEAVLGAIYLDQGLDYVIVFITKIFKDDIANYDPSKTKDYKSLLQEAVQGEHRESVTYKTVKEEGPSHNKTFYVEVLYNGIVLGKGKGKSKKEAEQNAANDALKKRAI